jgi:hypothetical protein
MSNKGTYESPVTEVIELKAENAILTASSEQYQPFEW